MAYSLARSFLLSSLVVAFLSSVRADLIDQVCSKTKNASLCTQTLRSDPRSRAADLHGLGIISIDKAQGLLKSFKQFVDKLSTVATSPVLKTRYGVCGQNSSASVDFLNSSKNYLNKKDYFNMVRTAIGAESSQEACDGEFDKPPSEPVLLKQANKKVQQLTNIVVVIASLLANQAF